MVARRPIAGFTLAELLVATAVTVLALGLAAALLRPASIAFQALPDALDAQQRLRAAVQTLAEDIGGAGAGPVLGWAAHASPAWPAVLPCRWLGQPLGLLPDGCHRQDAVTVLAMRLAAPQAAVAEDLASPSALIPLDPLSACALSRPACRFRAGARALISDGTGAWDLVPISAVSVGGSAIDHAPAGLSRL